MTTISSGVGQAQASARYHRLQLPDDIKQIDLKNLSAVSAASDFAFKTADADGDASLSIDEFRALGKKSPSDANAQALFAAIDGNSDGKLNSREVLGSGLLSPGNIQTLLGIDDLGAWMVSQADGDGDGGLTYNEYVESRGAGPFKATVVGPNGEKTEIQGYGLASLPQVFEKMDADGDGRLSASELGANLEAPEGYAQYNPSTGAERTSHDLVSRNDADADGALSADELATATKAPTYDGDDKAVDANALIAAADSNKDGKISGDEFAALAARRQTIAEYFTQGEADNASRVALTRLLRSTFSQLRNDFVAPAPRTDVTA